MTFLMSWLEYTFIYSPPRETELQDIRFKTAWFQLRNKMPFDQMFMIKLGWFWTALERAVAGNLALTILNVH